MNDRLREFVVVVRPRFSFTVYAKSEEQAFARVRGQIDKCPLVAYSVRKPEMKVKK